MSLIPSLGFIGAGKVAKIIANGLLSSGMIKPDQIFASSVAETDLEHFRDMGCNVLPDADGHIILDNVRIKELNLQEVRRYISVLGQSPVLFNGSLRKNLDVLDKFDEADLWRALEEVQLKEFVRSLGRQLDHEL